MTLQTTPIAFSGNIPVNYDSKLGPMYFEPYALALAERVGKLAPKKILELASGTGRLTAMLPAVAPGADITASDINPAMVSFGSNKVKNEKIRWMEIDAVSLPFEDATFDCVVVQYGVMFYSDKAKAFREALRVLKPGGTFLFSTWDDISLNPYSDLANQALKFYFPEDTPAFFSVPYSYYDKALIEHDLRQAGFSSIQIESLALTGYSSSPRSAAEGLIKGTPTVTAIEDRDPAVLPVLLEHLEASIERHFGKERLEVPLMAWIVSGKKG